MTSCTLWMTNETKRKMSSLVVWHTYAPPLPPDVLIERAVLNHSGLEHERGVKVVVPLEHSPFDFWTIGCQFEGSDDVYLVCNLADLPYKEFAVSDGDILNFIFKEEALPGNFPVEVKYNGDYQNRANLANAKQIAILELVDALLLVF